MTTIQPRVGNGLPAKYLKTLVRIFVGPSNESLLPFIPRPIKLLIAFIFLLNWRSWPLVWHFNVFQSVIKIRWDKLLKVRTKADERKWSGSISCVGGNPFELVSTIKYCAGVDSTDYNGHLSNSSYAKACDAARMQAAIEVFPAIFGDGAWMALAGGNYQFIREIPYGTNYEVKTVIGSWDNKWMYLLHYFVTYPSKSTRAKAKKPQGDTAPMNGMALPITPSLLDSPPVPGTPKASPEIPYKAPANIPKFKVKAPLPEGALLHCIAISTYCFKIGRITIPPAVAFIAGGLGDPSKQRWFRVQELRYSSRFPPASAKPVQKNLMPDILKGGWKTDVVEGWEQNSEGVSAFWELAEYEERRAQNVKAIFGGIQQGLQTLKERGY